MISGDFFCNSSRPSCRVSGASIVLPYPTGSIIPAAVVETICYRFASPCVPSRSPRLHATPRLPFRFSARRAGRFGLLSCRYSRNGEISICRFPPCPPLCLIVLSSRPSSASRLPPRPPCRGAGRRPFPRVCVDIMDCLICIYDLPSVCYSIGVEREREERTPK